MTSFPASRSISSQPICRDESPSMGDPQMSLSIIGSHANIRSSIHVRASHDYAKQHLSKSDDNIKTAR